jgi:hypothetical protein
MTPTRGQFLIGALAALVLGAVAVAPPVQAIPTSAVTFAMTFDTATAATWLHTSMTTGKPVGSAMGAAVPLGTRTGGTEMIPSDVRAVPGVVSTDTNVGMFPAYSSTPTNFSAYVVKPTVFGATEALAPGTRKFVFGADLRLNTGATTGVQADNGNNVVQRGLAGGDQYKIQADVVGGVPGVNCVVRDEGVLTAETPAVVIQPGLWVRARCTRVVTGGGQHLTLTVTYPGGEVANPPSSMVTFTTVANLNYASSSLTNPIPLTMGAKVNNEATSILSADSDQFNGQLDNLFLKIY